MPEAAEEALEAKEKDRTVAIIIAVLALFLALSETGAKKAEHHSTEKNIESSDLYNFYQAKRIRSTVVETATKLLETEKAGAADPKAQQAIENQVDDFKKTVANYEKDQKHPDDSMDAILDRAKEAVESRELSNHKLEHYEMASGLIQIAIVLASAAIITGMTALIWMSVGAGVIGFVLMAFGFFAPTVLTFLG
jgi:hypothetical protein